MLSPEPLVSHCPATAAPASEESRAGAAEWANVPACRYGASVLSPSGSERVSAVSALCQFRFRLKLESKKLNSR